MERRKSIGLRIRAVVDSITSNSHKRGTGEEARGRLGTRFCIPGQLRRGGTMITLAYKSLGVSARVVRVVWTRILGLCAAARVIEIVPDCSHRLTFWEELYLLLLAVLILTIITTRCNIISHT